LKMIWWLSGTKKHLVNYNYSNKFVDTEVLHTLANPIDSLTK